MLYYRKLDCDAIKGEMKCECKGYKLHSDETVCDLVATHIEWEGTDYDSHYHLNEMHLSEGVLEAIPVKVDDGK